MRRLGAVAGAAALALTGLGAAHADVSGPAVVEGSAEVLYVQDNAEGSRDVEWLCGAETSGAVAMATSAGCELRQGERVIDSTGVTLYGNKVAIPRLSTVPHGAYQICWKAYAFGFEGELAEDVTQPNCRTFSAAGSETGPAPMTRGS